MMFDSLLKNLLGKSEEGSKQDNAFASPFVLPIKTLGKDLVHPVPTAVMTDLELVESTNPGTDGSKPMNHFLFGPSTPFSKRLAKDMMEIYTTDVAFLTETQGLIEGFGTGTASGKTEGASGASRSASAAAFTPPVGVYDGLAEMLADFEDRCAFMEKYNYVEWEALEHVNRSSSFLQGVSILNGVVPFSNIVMTFLILLLPLIVIFFYGRELSFASYLEHLRLFGRDNIFSHLFAFLEPGSDINLQTSMTLLAGILLYAYQLYYNIQCTIQFFTHLSAVSRHLCQTKAFFESARQKLTHFIVLCTGKPRYRAFAELCQQRLLIVDRVLAQMSRVCETGYNLSTLGQMGYHFECYYLFFADADYRNTLLFCMDFDGYYDNMAAVSAKCSEGRLAKCQYGSSVSARLSTVPEERVVEGLEEQSHVLFQGMYYPTFVSNADAAVKNDVDLSEQNYIITGPNASGKTTLLKTTAINVLLSQQFGCGFYSSGVLAQPYHHIHSYINIPDTSERDSLFEAETRRCKEILTRIADRPSSERHFCIFDELFSGTNPEEASSSAYSYLRYLCLQPQVDFVLTTHYLSVCERVQQDQERLDMAKEDKDAEEHEDEDKVLDEEEVADEVRNEIEKALQGGIKESAKVGEKVAEKVAEPAFEPAFEPAVEDLGRGLVNYRMKVDKVDDKLAMKYRLEPGISEIKGAVYILENMGFPEEMMRGLRPKAETVEETAE
jgi:hypothetical protein